MKKIRFFLCAVLFALLLPLVARADTGPKPSVQIRFEGLGSEPCYGTLLSKASSTGPASAWDGDEEHIYNYGQDPEIWRAFAAYEDADGYYFLQESWRVDQTGSLAWTYYPPSPFKILLWFPESGTFAVSGVYERYAFDSYFSVNMTGFALTENARLSLPAAVQSYDYTWELISLASRIGVTLVLEIAIALLFGYRAKKQLALIVGVNAVTQIVLNLMLNFVNYQYGYLTFVFDYLFLELLVCALEAAVFATWLPRLSERPSKKSMAIWYALAANVFSFIAGFAIAKILPGIF